jgi:biopolymer transport protein ExbD
MDASKPEIQPYVWERHSFTGRKFPKRRIVRSFLLMVPWINLVAMGVLLWCFSQQTLVQPGRVVMLPEGPAEEGLSVQAPSAVIRTLEAPGRKDVTVLLLDEGRYCSDSPSELEALTRAYPGHELNLIVDVSISYGTVMTWIERLKACGVERINLVTVADAASDYPGSETH